jgi:DNA-directed RNA polymerase subunit N (RpoN/RPB10)
MTFPPKCVCGAPIGIYYPIYKQLFLEKVNETIDLKGKPIDELVRDDPILEEVLSATAELNLEPGIDIKKTAGEETLVSFRYGDIDLKVGDIFKKLEIEKMCCWVAFLSTEPLIEVLKRAGC